MPSPLGHAMAGAMTAWVAEMSARRSRDAQPALIAAKSAGKGEERPRPLLDRSLTALADIVSPLAVTCSALAVLPDFDVFLHTHRTYSHSLGAAAIVWGLVAFVAWRLRLPVVKTATTCAAAYASHVLLDWLGRDDSRLAGPMALWPLTTAHFKSGLDLFLEFTLLHKRRFDLGAMFARNAHALLREVTILGPPFLLVLMFRATISNRGRDAASLPRLPACPSVARNERG